MNLEETVEQIRPIGGYAYEHEMAHDVEQLIEAENPVQADLDRSMSIVDRVGEPDLLSIDNVSQVADDELEQAIDEYDGIRKEMSEMYRTKAEYLEWECRRAYLLEAIANVASIQFGHKQSPSTERHRIVVEVNMWAAYAKHLLMEVNAGDVAAAEEDHDILTIDVQHDINDAIMTTSTIFESVGEQILIRNHNYSSGNNLNMSKTTEKLKERGYITTREKQLVDKFRKNIRNNIAHDIFQRSRLTGVSDLRSEIVKPCWEIIDLTDKLADEEISPDNKIL